MSANHASIRSLSRSATSAKVSPSHSPNSISAKPGSSSTGSPSEPATMSAVSRVRRTGEATTTSMLSLSSVSHSATSAAWVRPSSDSGGLSPPSPPENRRPVVWAVTP